MKSKYDTSKEERRKKRDEKNKRELERLKEIRKSEELAAKVAKQKKDIRRMKIERHPISRLKNALDTPVKSSSKSSKRRKKRRPTTSQSSGSLFDW